MNKIILSGRLTKDPELYTNEAGTSNCKFTIAVPRIGAKEGLQQTDFFRCTAWNKQAENLVKYQKKGSFIIVEGELRADNYEDKEGNARINNYIFVNRIEFTGNSNEEQKGETKEETVKEDVFTEFSNEVDLTDLELPF